MEYITLKNSDLKVSRLCMGGCPMGGYGWGDVQEQELTDAVHTCLDKGINFFDTSDTYGLGQSERTLSKALGEHRKDVIIQTKFGVRYANGGSTYDNSPAYIEEALEKSLKNLNTDYVDVYLLHVPSAKMQDDEQVFETMKENTYNTYRFLCAEAERPFYDAYSSKCGRNMENWHYDCII